LRLKIISLFFNAFGLTVNNFSDPSRLNALGSAVIIKPALSKNNADFINHIHTFSVANRIIGILSDFSKNVFKTSDIKTRIMDRCCSLMHFLNVAATLNVSGHYHH
jgi:hypothetical protein